MSTISDLEPFHLIPESVRDILGKNTKQVMVYGFESAGYKKVRNSLMAGGHNIQKIFEGAVVSNTSGFVIIESARETLEGDSIDVIPRDFSGIKRQAIARECKSAITGLIVENYKREKQGLPLIPLLFCMDIVDATGKSVINLSVGQLTQRALDRKITLSELRRAYKHCKEFEKSEEPRLQQLAKIAQETLVFVRVESVSGGKYKFTRVLPIWEEKEWETAWKQRMESRSVDKKQEKKHEWRVHVKEAIGDFVSKIPEKEEIFKGLLTLSKDLDSLSVLATSKLKIPKEFPQIFIENIIVRLRICKADEGIQKKLDPLILRFEKIQSSSFDTESVLLEANRLMQSTNRLVRSFVPGASQATIIPEADESRIINAPPKHSFPL